jgi:hypothetical protein
MVGVVLIERPDAGIAVKATWLAEHVTSGISIEAADVPSALVAIAGRILDAETRRTGLPD